MKNPEIFAFVAAVLLLAAALALFPPKALEPVNQPVTCSKNPKMERIALPAPDFSGKTLEKAIGERRSIREYAAGALSLDELSMLLWAGNGITDNKTGFRAAPSAGALYPIDVYLLPNRVDNASCGFYRYLPKTHEIILVKEGEFSQNLSTLAFSQTHIKSAAVDFVLVAVPERTTPKYGERGNMYAHMEAGHIAQNMLLQAVSLGLAAVPTGGFEPNGTGELIGLEKGKEEAIYIVSVGKKR